MKKRRCIITILMGMVLVMICLYLISSLVILKTQVKGASMSPTLNEGDNILIDRISYRLRSPKRYDVIVFPYKYRDDTYYIKRIIGMPWERVKIVDNQIYINDKILEDTYGNGMMTDAGLASYEIELAGDEYFVLGDNRSISRDSREPDVGNVKREWIIGKAVFLLESFPKVKWIE